jgi:hypothetical protein
MRLRRTASKSKKTLGLFFKLGTNKMGYCRLNNLPRVPAAAELIATALKRYRRARIAASPAISQQQSTPKPTNKEHKPWKHGARQQSTTKARERKSLSRGAAKRLDELAASLFVPMGQAVKGFDKHMTNLHPFEHRLAELTLGMREKDGQGCFTTVSQFCMWCTFALVICV